MSKVDVNKEFYNKLYKKRNPLVSFFYSKISFDQQSKSKLNIQIIKSYLNAKFNDPITVLDYGFGHGSLLLKYKSQHKLYGCDISEEAVFNFPAVASLVGKTVLTGTVEEFLSKYRDVKFDVISLSHIIEHVEDDVELVSSLSEKLTDKGIMLINVPINEVWEDPKHVRKYDVPYLESVLTKSGLKSLYTAEADKLTSFFLIEEKVKQAGKLKIVLIKLLRLLFAITPLSLTQAFEKAFLSSHKNQQLIVLASKI